MTNETLVMVDNEDNVLGREPRQICHEGYGKAHRAISTLIFNHKGEVLLQQRSKQKQLWPGYWDVSCATHVHPEETYESAGERRLPQELGFARELEYLAKFQYQINYTPNSSENEMCALLLGKYDGAIKSNGNEIKDYKWIRLDDLVYDISANPEKFTPWLKLSLEELQKNRAKADEILKELSLFEKKIKKPEIGKNLKEEYYNLLTKVGKTVDEVVLNFYENEIFREFPEKKQLYKKMLDRKIGTQKLRAMAAYLAFMAFNGEKILDDEKVRRIIAAVELENWSNYELNWVFDGKSNTRDILAIKEAGLATHGFMNDALRLVWDMPEISRTFLEINDRVHRGWTPELYDLTLENKAILSDFEKFWKAYEIRNIEAGGQFYGNYVTLAYQYSGHKNDLLHKQLKKIYQDFGAYVQIVNDIGDFALKPKDSRPFVSEKVIADQFSDLRNGPVTWPTWLMYNRCSNEDRNFLHSVAINRELDSEGQARVSKLFYETGTYDTLCQALRTKKQRLEQKIHCLDIEPRTRGLIKSMIVMIPSNRIVHTLDNIQKESQGGNEK